MKIPSPDILQKLSVYFGVSVSDLLGENTKNKPVHIQDEHDIMDEVDVAFYGDYKDLSDDDKETIRDMVRLMRQRREKK